MLSSEQIGFLSAFPDFKVKHDSTPAIVFTELATLRKWKVGGRKHTKYYEAFFKYHDDSSDSSSEEGSRVIISRALSEDSSSQDEHESIVGQLEGSLKHLRLNTSTFGPAMNSQTTASLRSRSDGAGVKVRYFDSFQGFMPNNQAPIKQEFARLALQQGWKRENGMLVKHTVYHKQMLRCYSEELFFHSRGSLPYLAVLQGLCADLRVTTVPGSVKACKNIIKKHYVNIFEFINCKRAGTPIPKKVVSAKNHVKACDFFPKAAAKKYKANKVLLHYMH